MTSNRQPPTANRQPPTATNRQPPTANRHQPDFSLVSGQSKRVHPAGQEGASGRTRADLVVCAGGPIRKVTGFCSLWEA